LKNYLRNILGEFGLRHQSRTLGSRYRVVGKSWRQVDSRWGQQTPQVDQPRPTAKQAPLPPMSPSRCHQLMSWCLAHLPINRRGGDGVLHPFTHIHHTPPLCSLAL
jgi:hypothetical protein